MCEAEEDGGETCILPFLVQILTINPFLVDRVTEVEFAPGSSCGVLDFRLRSTIKSGVVPQITSETLLILGGGPNFSLFFIANFGDPEPEVDAADACDGA